MARPKSEDKRNAILDAATRLFAERGLAAAPTSEISNWAGVAEGTLFTYFRPKDDLINSLYRKIQRPRTLTPQQALSRSVPPGMAARLDGTRPSHRQAYTGDPLLSQR